VRVLAGVLPGEKRRCCVDLIPLLRCRISYNVQVISFTIFLLSSDIFIVLRCVACLQITCPTNTTPSQGICGHFQKQDPRGILWDPDIGEIGDGARTGFPQTSDVCGIPSSPSRCFQYVYGGYGPQTYANSELIRHRVRYVTTLARIVARGSVADRGIHLELSAFLVVAWYTYRNKAVLKLSALVRTIVSEATIYFLVMVAVQTYIQISLSVMEV